MNKTVVKILTKIDWTKFKPEAITTTSGKVYPVTYSRDEFGEYIDLLADDFPEEFKVVLTSGESGVPQAYRFYYKLY